MEKERKKQIFDDVKKLLDKYNFVEDHLFITLIISENFKEMEEEYKEFLKGKIHPALWGNALKK